MNRRTFLIMSSSSLALAACSSLPGSGPQVSSVVNEATTAVRNSANALKYALVDISKAVIDALGDPGPGSLFKSFGMGHKPAPGTNIGVGDSLQVTIFESAAGGLFIPDDAGARAGNFIQLPAQSVDDNGNITVPYAGAIRAKGRALPDIQKDIVQKLSSRAIEPQVIVTETSSTANMATVIGRVGGANKIAILSGDRVLDLLARTGGIADAGYQTFITLQRGKVSSTIFFLNLVNNPQENIYVQPNDTIYVYAQSRTYTVFGASGATSNTYAFTQEHILLSDALGLGGGFADAQANPGYVLLYRHEKRAVLEQIGADLKDFAPTEDPIPTIYRVNFRDPSGYFVAKAFYVHDRDIIYVTNSDSYEITKFLGFINTATAGASTPVTNIATTRTQGALISQHP